MIDGKPARERLPGERAPDPCDFGCSHADKCFVEAGMFDAEAEAIARTWALCGGLERRVWPRAGGIQDQDAGVVATFEGIDAMVAMARDRELKRATGQGR
jgi:hypothetical protein